MPTAEMKERKISKLEILDQVRDNLLATMKKTYNPISRSGYVDGVLDFFNEMKRLKE